MTDEVETSVRPAVLRAREKEKAYQASRKRPPRPGECKRQALLGQEYRKLRLQVPKGARTPKNLKLMQELKGFLRESWARAAPQMKDWRYFTEKQIAFARQYALSGRTNKAAAIRAAGYSVADHRDAWDRATKNLKLPFMEELIQAFELEEKLRMKINVEDVVKWFNDIATAAMESGDFTNANRAMENLAKYLGMFVEKKEIIHKTVHSKEELDTRIAELTAILRDAEPDIERKLRIH